MKQTARTGRRGRRHAVRRAASAVWIAIAIYCAGAPALALCPQNLNLQVGDRTVDFEFDTDTSGAPTFFRVKFGLTSGSLGFQSRQIRANNTSRDSRFVPLTGLAPATTYYFDPQVSDLNGINWSDAASCESELCPTVGSQPGGYVCEDVGGGELRPKLTTLALDAPAQRTPAAPLHDFDPAVIPAVTGTSFSVTLDSEGLCMDFQAQLNACAAADPNLVHEILIPAGAVCRPEAESLEGYVAPTKSGTGTCIVRTSVDPLLLPPPGVRADPTFRAHMASIETNRATRSISHARLLAEPFCATPPCTQGWRFEAVVFQHPEHRDLARNRLDIISVDTSTGVITVSAPHNLQFFDGVQVNAPGLHDREFHRSCRVGTFPTADTFRCFTKQGPISGSYAGGGTITTAVSVPLTGCTAGSPVVCTTAEPHGYGNFHSFSIASISNGMLTTSTAHTLQSRSAVIIEGTPGGAWDGIYELAGPTGTTGTLNGAPSGVCNPCSGTVRQLGMLTVLEVRGAEEEKVNQTHLFSVIDATRVQLEQSSASGTLAGGFISYDPPVMTTLIEFRNSQRIVFDRCIVDLRGTPYRNGVGFNWVSTDSALRTSSAVIDSWMRGDSAWYGVNPISRVAIDTGQSVFSDTGFFHQLHRTRDFQLRNNMLESNAGIVVFADANAENPEDLSFVRNVFWTPLRLVSGREQARGHYYTSRHHLELKAARRALVRGNFFSGNPANGSPSGAPLLLSLSGPVFGDGVDRTLRDIEIIHNVLHRNGGFIDLGGSLDATSDTKSPQRILVTHNLGVEVDAVRNRTFPAGQAGHQPNGWPLTVSPFIGRSFLSYAETEDHRVEHNTITPTFGHGPFIWLASGEASGGTVVDSNIVPLSRSAIFQFGLQADLSGANYLPAPSSSSGYDFWKTHYRQGPGVSDPLAVWDNVVLPCTDFAEDLDREATLLKTNTMASFSAQHFSCTGGCPANFSNQIVASDGLHCLDRMQELFGSSTDFRLPPSSPYTGYGADIDAIRVSQGRVRDVAFSVTPISATLTYEAPDADACFVDFGEDKHFSTPVHARLNDGGGAVQRSVLLPNLETLTTYHFRLLCRSDQPRGVFLTLPGGPG